MSEGLRSAENEQNLSKDIAKDNFHNSRQKKSLLTENSPKRLKLIKMLLMGIKESIGFVAHNVSSKGDKIKDSVVHSIRVICV